MPIVLKVCDNNVGDNGGWFEKEEFKQHSISSAYEGYEHIWLYWFER